MRKVLRGIQALHPAQEKRARPLQIDQLERVARWLDEQTAVAIAANDRPSQRRHVRDKALLLLGFWRAIHGDELSRLQVEHVGVVRGEGMTCFLPQTKADRGSKGTSFKTPALARLYPVAAYQRWIEVAGITRGAVFRGIDRWGHIRPEGIHINRLVPLLRSIFARVRILSAAQYSGHFMRRGFAHWATANGWDIKTLMQYVGWKDVHSAIRYVEGTDPFANAHAGVVRIERD